MNAPRTTIDARQDLLDRVAELAGRPVDEAMIDAALTEYLRHLSRLESLKNVNTFDFDENWDIKSIRRGPRDQRELP